MPDNPYRKLPPVNAVLALLTDAVRGHGQENAVAAIRAELDELRRSLPESCDAASVAAKAEARLRRALAPKLVPVVNATGIVLHTNLGRAPLAEEAQRAATAAAGGYLNLEMDLGTGKRSSRQDAISEWVCRLTGAEAATAVNNNAAATVIVLRAVCLGREAVVSRGQLIEIGGSFRIPDIMAVSGAVLREVGTTNITRLADYEKAIGERTGALLQVHTSNYRISGFTESVPLAELAALGKSRGVPVIDDIGSGAMVDFGRFGFAGEPVARQSIEAGADLVLFSGDKLLGGPQAGLIAGKKEWIARIEKDPLMRAFRLDKMTLAALEATLRLYLNEERALREVPVLRMLGAPLEELERRARMLAEALSAIPGVAASAARDVAYVGGGALPDRSMPTWVVEVEAGMGEGELSSR
ncbi:MAG: L-seryl-tRNA(Sec) selenium transferase, partial [Gemmataceae bacterium]|nr:L-seryl-tRNA(Sec) selenium transferase [Gemmataceae bacterium]